MLTVDEALAAVLTHAQPRAPRALAIGDALGLVLAEGVRSDIDSPPYDKSLVDGYALVAADLATGECVLVILEEVVAGKVPTKTVRKGFATRIMTGAPIPQGADAVAMFEHSEPISGPVAGIAGGGLGSVRIRARLGAGQNIMTRAAAMKRGDLVVRAVRRIRPGDIGAICEAGRESVSAYPSPSLAVLSTGDELVPIGQFPGPGQIRNSNGPMLVALARSAGAVPLDLGIGRDDKSQLRALMARGLECDVLAISGGVSAGVLDLVPAVLAELGIKQVFHKVHFKPGKPLWFGTLAGPAGDKLVFGLPGNPVSSFVCFELFVRPAIRRLAGDDQALRPLEPARLAGAHTTKGDRPTYHPAHLETREGQFWVQPLRWEGSADLRVLALADALAYFPAGERQYDEGAIIEVYRLS
ncbi:MAG: molybdopterin molybdotransferase MoeA [Planctomycetia bacterium]|nr:molybdopterin molybdotransferase MoeA [Planctomycetia bacterium]